jgi:hypothetical protein
MRARCLFAPSVPVPEFLARSNQAGSNTYSSSACRVVNSWAIAAAQRAVGNP